MMLLTNSWTYLRRLRQQLAVSITAAARAQHGQADVEYALLLALLAATCVVAAGSLGGGILSLLSSVASAL
jgi:Flp pilus assembly pilin Flp